MPLENVCLTMTWNTQTEDEDVETVADVTEVARPRPLKLYFANMTFPPVGGPGVWRVMAMCKYSVQAGHDVTVFCADRASWHDRSDPSLVSRLPPELHVVRLKSVFLRDITDWLHRRRAATRLAPMARLYGALHWRFSRDWPDPIFHWAIKVSFRIWRYARRERPDCVITSGPQHLVHLAGFVARSLLHVPWIMDYRDPWTGFGGTRHHAGGGYQAKLFQRVEQRFLARADAVVAVSPSLRAGLAARLPAQAAKFHLIRNGHDLAAQTPPEVADAPGSSDAGAVWIHFNGVIQTASDVLTELREAAEQLVLGGRRLRLTFCGLPAPFVERLKGSPARDCFVDFGPLEHAESIRRCLQADAVLVAVSGTGDGPAGIIPGKTYEAMALGLFVLGIIPRTSDVRELLKDYGQAIATAHNDTAGILAALEALLRRFDDAAGHLPRAPEAVRQRVAWDYSRARQAQELLDLVRDVRRVWHG